MKFGCTARRTSTAIFAPSRTVREVRRTVREVEHDRPRLGEEATVFDLEHRDASVGVDLLKNPRGARLAPGEVVLDALERDAELRQEEPDLLAVAGDQGVVQPDHRTFLDPSAGAKKTSTVRSSSIE